MERQMNDFKLSDHFTFYELTRTDKPEFQTVNREKALGYVSELTGLCRIILEPIRAHYNRPVIIHSGFRCEELNAAVGGSKTSRHMQGMAADFHIAGVLLDEAFAWLWKESDIPFGQLIDERRSNSRWLHVSAGGTREVLMFHDGKYEVQN
jgi:hypothetical protein